MTWTITTTTTLSASRAVTLAERIPGEPIKLIVLHPGTGAGGAVTIWDDLGRSVASTRIDALNPRHEAEFYSDRSVFNVSAAIDGNATLSGAGVSVYLVSRKAPDASVADGTLVSSGPIAESLACVYGDESAASGNTAKLQAALDAKSLSLTAPGIVYINGTLIFDSDTRIKIGMGVTIKMIPGTNKNIFRTASYLRMKNTPNSATVELKAGEYQRAYITGAVAHGLSVGDYIWLNRPGAVNADANWNGVHRVEAITNSTDFVVTIKYPIIGATSFAGNWVVSTQRVTLDCDGTIDYSYQPPDPLADMTHGFGFYLVGTAKIFGRAPSIENCYNYAFYSLASAENRIINARGKYTNKDGVKVYGPSFDDYYEDINFNSRDDVFSVQAREPAAYQNLQPYWGNVNHITVNGVYGISRAASVCAIYGSNDAFMDFIEISGVRGYCQGGSASLIRITSGSGEDPNKYQIGLLRISNINASRSLTSVINAMRARDIRLSDILDTYAGYSCIVETGNNVIDSYTVDKLRVKLSQGDTAFALVLGAESGGTSSYGRVTVSDAILEGTTNLLKVNASATVNAAIIVSNMNNMGANNPIQIGAANTPLIVDGAYMSPAGASIAQASVACSATFRRISGTFTSLLKLIGSTTFGVDLNADESVTPTLSTGIVTHTNANASLRRVKLPVALPVSLSAAWLSRTAGSQVTASANTGSGGATDILAGNTAICDASGAAGSWHQISAPTRVY